MRKLQGLVSVVAVSAVLAGVASAATIAYQVQLNGSTYAPIYWYATGASKQINTSSWSGTVTDGTTGYFHLYGGYSSTMSPSWGCDATFTIVSSSSVTGLPSWASYSAGTSTVTFNLDKSFTVDYGNLYNTTNDWGTCHWVTYNTPYKTNYPWYGGKTTIDPNYTGAGGNIAQTGPQTMGYVSTLHPAPIGLGYADGNSTPVPNEVSLTLNSNGTVSWSGNSVPYVALSNGGSTVTIKPAEVTVTLSAAPTTQDWYLYSSTTASLGYSGYKTSKAYTSDNFPMLPGSSPLYVSTNNATGAGAVAAYLNYSAANGFYFSSVAGGGGINYGTTTPALLTSDGSITAVWSVRQYIVPEPATLVLLALGGLALLRRRRA